MKKILYGALAICLLSPASLQAAGADYDTLSEMAATVTASDFIPIFDASEADGSRMKKRSFDGTATNCLTGLGTFAAFAPALGVDDNYVTDAEKTIIGNTSGTNTGDQTTITGNAGTATALAANGGNCDAGSYALGVDASGAAEGCTAAPTAASLAVDDLITLSGVASGAVNLGAFTGSTIADNQTIKAAIQALETFAETLDGGVDFTAYDDVTWGAAAGGSQTHTFDTGAGTDPAVTISDTAFTYNKGLVALSFTTSGADGTHYVSALNTAALSSTATDGNLAFLSDRYYLGDGTDYNDYLLSKELSDTSAELYGILSDETGSAAGTPLSVFNQNPTIDDATFGAAGVKLTDDGDGAITLLGLGDGSDEDLTINLDDTVNTATISSSTGVTSINTGSIGIASTGPISGQTSLLTDAAGAITITVNAVNYGTDTGDADIPDGACDAAGDVGNWVVLISSAADVYALTSNDASNQFVIAANAAALTAGNELDVDGTMVSVVCIAAELWKVTGYMGAIPTDGGAAD